MTPKARAERAVIRAAMWLAKLERETLGPDTDDMTSGVFYSRPMTRLFIACVRLAKLTRRKG